MLCLAGNSEKGQTFCVCVDQRRHRLTETRHAARTDVKIWQHELGEEADATYGQHRAVLRALDPTQAIQTCASAAARGFLTPPC